MARQTGWARVKYLFGPKGAIALVDMLALVGQLFLICALSCVAIIIAVGLYIAGLMVHTFVSLLMALFIPGVETLARTASALHGEGDYEESGRIRGSLENISELMFSWASSLFARGVASVVGIFYPRQGDSF